jgi:Ca-activated chloride channel family protein
MRDAISVSIEHVKKSGKKDKKVLIVVTDGDDHDSRVTMKNLIGRLQGNQGVVVYTIGLLAEENRYQANEATQALNAIAVASGGVPYLPKRTDDIERICQQIARDIRSQYIIEYTPLNSALDGSFRQIKVSVAGPNRPTVRTRTGYYATPEHGETTANLRK